MTPSFVSFAPCSAFSRCLPKLLFTHLCLSFSFWYISCLPPFFLPHLPSISANVFFFFVLPSHLSGSIFHSLLSLWSFFPICLFEMDTRTTNAYLQVLAHVPSAFSRLLELHPTIMDTFSLCVCVHVHVLLSSSATHLPKTGL